MINNSVEFEKFVNLEWFSFVYTHDDEKRKEKEKSHTIKKWVWVGFISEFCWSTKITIQCLLKHNRQTKRSRKKLKWKEKFGRDSISLEKHRNQQLLCRTNGTTSSCVSCRRCDVVKIYLLHIFSEVLLFLYVIARDIHSNKCSILLSVEELSCIT